METLLHFKSFLDELSKDNSRLYKMEVLDIPHCCHYNLVPLLERGIIFNESNRNCKENRRFGQGSNT